MSRRRPMLRAQIVETLESRRMLAADPASLLAKGFEEMQWQGQTVYVRPDQWIANLGGLKGAAGNQLQAVNRAIASGQGGGVKAVQHLGKDGLILLESATDKSYKQVQRALATAAGLDVSALEPDFAIWTEATTPNDQLYAAHNWGLNNTGQTG